MCSGQLCLRVGWQAGRPAVWWEVRLGRQSLRSWVRHQLSVLAQGRRAESEDAQTAEVSRLLHNLAKESFEERVLT